MLRTAGLVLALSFACSLIAAASSPGENPSELPSNLHAWVVERTENGQRADFFIVLRAQADLSPARTLAGKQDKGRFVFSALTQVAEATQGPLHAWLVRRGVRFQPYWIVNAILVRGGDRALAVEAARRQDVARVEGNPAIRNLLPVPGPIEESGGPAPMAAPESAAASGEPDSIAWNINKVQAPAVWGLGHRGGGIVVAGQDSGVRWTHHALKSKYRGWNGTTADHNYNWHDAIHEPGSSCGADSPVPCDDSGHGTHTMGTLVGDDGGANQIGMAPDAKWIGCRSMNVGVGSPATYLECFQFFLAPTKIDGSDPDPSRAPDVTNNSWGCLTSEGCSWDTLQAAVDAQKAAGIMTVTSAGNTGPHCNTITDPPAMYRSAYTVGSTTSYDSISYSSSRGYAAGTGAMKPEIVAPGANVRSAWNSSDAAYTTMDGTSMASPHVAGAVALLWSARSCFLNRQDDTQSVLDAAAQDMPGTVESCGGDYAAGPNNTWGHGRLNVLAAVDSGCLCTAPGVPTIEDATVSGESRITVSWQAGTPGGTTYRIYRAFGNCPGDGSALVRSGHSASPWTDTDISGGVTYAYTVAAVDATGGCESTPSACVSTTGTGPCRLAPSFAGLASVSNPGLSTCTLELAWSPATPFCSGPVRYRVYRSAISPVALVPANLIASGVEGTSYTDAVGLAGGATYHYAVRAVDLSNGSEDTNTVERAGAPSGPISMQTVTETFEAPGGFDRPGWSTAALNGTVNWTWSDNYAQSPTHSWYARDAGLSGDKVLTSPAFGVQADTSLSFYHAFRFEGTGASCRDGGTLEYAVGPYYAVWTVVPDSWFTNGAFNGSVATCCDNPLAGKRAWCMSNSSDQRVALGLGALAGETVRLRWHEGEDSSGAATGWSVDSVTFGKAAFGAGCEAGTAPPPPVVESVIFARAGGNLLSVRYDAATCSAEKVIVLYNALGSWNGYAGCAQPDGGHDGSTVVDSSGQVNVWYNLVWTAGGTAGPPGMSSSGPRGWTVGALCGMSGDDHGRQTCP